MKALSKFVNLISERNGQQRGVATSSPSTTLIPHPPPQYCLWIMRSFDIYDFNLFDKFHTRVINWLDASLLILLGPSLIFSLTVRGNKFWRISALIRGIGRGPHEGPESRKCAEQANRVGRKLFRMASTVIMSIIIYFYFATSSQQGVRQNTTTCVCGSGKGGGSGCGPVCRIVFHKIYR